MIRLYTIPVKIHLVRDHSIQGHIVIDGMEFREKKYQSTDQADILKPLDISPKCVPFNTMNFDAMHR